MTLIARGIARIIEPQWTMEGAGVKLKRSIATAVVDHVDPFLLFDHFGSDNPDDYIKGFPMHPHRGIETVTYMIRGMVNHKDSMGNTGTIGSGDVQWMTSGGGIMHEEMPRPDPVEMTGFQLWVNLPARLKMTSPRYQNILAEEIPTIVRKDGVSIRVIAGKVDGIAGPVTDIVAAPNYLDITVPAEVSFTHPVPEGHTALIYVFEGAGTIGPIDANNTRIIAHPKMVILGDGNAVMARGSDPGVRFLLITGKPFKEPIARYGPFVMNTPEEIEQALADLKAGTFVR